MSRRDMFLALLVVVLWGVHFPVIKTGTNEIPGLLLVTLRFLITGILFLPFAKNLSKPQGKQMLLFSAYYYMMHLPLLFVAIRYLESATVALIMQAQVPFAMILGWILYNERFRWKTSVGLALAFIGLLFIFGSPDITSYIGLGLTIASAFMWALGSLHMRKISDVDMPSMTAYSCLLAAPVTLILSLVFEQNQVQEVMTADWWKLSFVLAFQVFLMSLMMYVWKQLLSRNTVQYVTAFSLLQPVCAVVSAHYMLDEKLSVTSLIGGALAMAGVAVIIVRRIQKKQPLIDQQSFLGSE